MIPISASGPPLSGTVVPQCLESESLHEGMAGYLSNRVSAVRYIKAENFIVGSILI